MVQRHHDLMIKSDSRFLFLLYFTPPAPGTAPKRNFRILRYISQHVQHSILFTANYPGKQAVVLPNVETHSIHAFDYRRLLRKRNKAGYLREQQKTARWKQWGIRLINTFPFNILIGEGGLLYINSVLRKANQHIQQDKITHLYSSFRPFADHYIAYRLKKKYPALIWIADFRDLIIDPHYEHHLFTKNQEKNYKRIFSSADLITTVSEGLAEKLRSYGPEVAVIRNSISAGYQIPQPVTSKYFTITYTGSMFLNTRNAQPLFDAIRSLTMQEKISLQDIRIVYAGKDSFYWNRLAKEYAFENIVVDKGWVEEGNSRQLQLDSCINLLLTISSPELQGVLTGKLIEYLEAGSPILSIVVGQNDPELQKILNELEIGQSYSDQEKDVKDIEEFIGREYLNWKNSGTNRKPVNVERLKSKYAEESVMKPLNII